MSQTSVSKSSGIALKKWSMALFSQARKQITPVNSLAGPAPTVDIAKKVTRGQSTTGMPIVRVTDLNESAGDTVRVDVQNVVKLRAVMGDENAEGKGAKLDYSYMDISIDMATLPVSAGGKMTQKRFQHDLRMNAFAQLEGGIPNFQWNRVLTHLAGARGQQDGMDWILPLDSDADFAAQMVNPVQAPTYNRHYVCDGSTLVQGGAQLGSIDSTDVMTLDHIDWIAALLSEMAVRMLPIRIPGDPAAADNPIKGLLLVDNLVWNSLITGSGANSIRQWQSNAMERAKYGNLQLHPLFAASPFLWNNVLVRPMGDFAVRFNADGSQKPAYVKAANRYTAAESTDVTIPNLTSGSNSYQVSRSLLLGAQALGMTEGGNTTTGVPYTMLENTTNFGRNSEMAGELIGGEAKLRFKLPDGQGNYEPTDIGVLVIDSITKRMAA